MRCPGKVSPTKAAKLLGVHRNTVYAWCHKTLNGELSVLRSVEQKKENGYLLISLAEIRQISNK